MTKHTLGPWTWKNVEFFNYYELSNQKGEIICDDGSAAGEYGRKIEPDSPDASLIASAPDLLAALDDLIEAISAREEKGERFDKSILRKCFVGEAEIAKAKGEI